MAKKLFECENKNCLYRELVETETKHGKLIWKICLACGWRMIEKTKT